MKQYLDPFEVVFGEQEESPLDFLDHIETQYVASNETNVPTRENNDEVEEEEEDNINYDKCGDLDEIARTQTILSRFTDEQMSRYEAFRRSRFAKMKKLLASITGGQSISEPLKAVVSGIAKMFVGELVETARIVMTERNESGPIRPPHIREAYRRLKLEGKVPKRSVPRLFQ